MRTPDPYPIGRFALVLADGVLVAANFIDKYPRTRRGKRVRLQTGEHAGEVRLPDKYKLIEYL